MKKGVSAVDFGRQSGSCSPAMEWRRSLGPNATQADAWQECQRGDWLFWQFSRLPHGMKAQLYPSIHQALDCIVARAIRRGQKSLRGVKAPWATAWRQWARQWLSGEDRSETAAGAAAGAVGTAAGAAVARSAAWAAWDAAWATWAVATGDAAAAVARSAWDSAASTAADTAAAATGATGARSAVAVARKYELRLQARDIRRVMPKWPG